MVVVTLGTLVQIAPDHQQPWVTEASIAERNLCTPTAFASQAGALYAAGVLPETPVGTPYPVGGAYDVAPGWMDFAYDGPGMRGSNPADYTGLASLPHAPSFHWHLNTNSLGATSVAGAAAGTFVISALIGATEFYSRTAIAGQTGHMLHKGSHSVTGVVPLGATSAAASDPGGTLAVLKASVDAGRTVVLFLDSYGVQDRNEQTDGDPSISLYNVGLEVANNPSTEDTYVHGENAESAVGHTVLMVGHLQFQGCEFVVVQDNDHTTPRFVGLPFDQACGGPRRLWDGLLASFFADPPVPAPVNVNFGFSQVVACTGSSVQVSWSGYHNIQEVTSSSCSSANIGAQLSQYYSSGHTETFTTELTAQPGETRYFKCSSHCNVASSRFEVSCPP